MYNSISRTGQNIWMQLILVVTLLTVVPTRPYMTSLDPFCPTDCQCDAKSVSCVDTAGSGLPLDQLPTDVTQLSIRNSNLSSTFAEQISRFHRLEQLQLIDCTNVDSLLGPGEPVQSLLALNLSDNDVTHLPTDAFANWPNLASLDLSGNRLVAIGRRSLAGLGRLRRLDLGRNGITAVERGAFDALAGLEALDLSRNQLAFLPPDAFDSVPSLRLLQLSSNNLSVLHHRTFRPLSATLQRLTLSGNPLDPCDCHLAWLAPWLLETGTTADLPCAAPAGRPCRPPVISNGTAEVVTRLGATALLECRASGNPAPSLTWILPRKHHVFHLFPPGPPTHWHFPYLPHHPLDHPATNASLAGLPAFARRIRVLRNGNLFISRVHQVDAGTYVCLAANALSNSTVTVTLSLNYQILVHVKIMSILVGVATSIALLLVLLVFRLVNMALGRWGCCCCACCCSCCRSDLFGSAKARQIRKLLETVETYRSQQLERLRDNYAQQVNRIKDNCAQQMDRIRESYGSQVDRLRDIRDFGTHQLDRVRDQYCEQVKRVRDYSSSQMSRVRENYVFQRTRIRKFSAHHMIRFRENYKLQQLHLNKILETLNIESCRTGCSRSGSMDFGPDPSTVFCVDLAEVRITAPDLPMVHSAAVVMCDDNQSECYFTPEDSGRSSPAHAVPEVELQRPAQPTSDDDGGDDCRETRV